MSWSERAWRGLLLGTMTLFVVNIGFMIAAVVPPGTPTDVQYDCSRCSQRG